MIGNINENMDCGTTNAEAYPKKEIDNQIYYRPREMGVIYNTAGDTKVNISLCSKVGSILPMVVVSIPPHAEFGPNGDRTHPTLAE